MKQAKSNESELFTKDEVLKMEQEVPSLDLNFIEKIIKVEESLLSISLKQTRALAFSEHVKKNVTAILRDKGNIVSFFGEEIGYVSDFNYYNLYNKTIDYNTNLIRIKKIVEQMPTLELTTFDKSEAPTYEEVYMEKYGCPPAYDQKLDEQIKQKEKQVLQRLEYWYSKRNQFLNY